MEGLVADGRRQTLTRIPEQAAARHEPRGGGAVCRLRGSGGHVTDASRGEFADWAETAWGRRRCGGDTILRLSLPYARGKVCAARAINLLLKITSVRSRAFPWAADTVVDPLPGSACPRWHAGGLRQATGSAFSSQGVARRPWRDTPCELEYGPTIPAWGCPPALSRFLPMGEPAYGRSDASSPPDGIRK
jgi:hypothetical protein